MMKVATMALATQGQDRVGLQIPLHIALARYNEGESDQMLSILLANRANTDIDFGGMPLKDFAEISGEGAFFKD